MGRRDYWEKRFDKRPVRTGLQLSLGLLACALVLGAVAWGVSVVFSGIKGQGDSVKTKNSSDNFISAQAQFQSDFQHYTTYKTEIAGAQKTLADFEKQPRPTDGLGSFTWQQQDENLRTTLTGLTQSCQSMATDYNTRSHSYLTQDFKDASLPEQLDAAQCQPVGAP